MYTLSEMKHNEIVASVAVVDEYSKLFIEFLQLL